MVECRLIWEGIILFANHTDRRRLHLAHIAVLLIGGLACSFGGTCQTTMSDVPGTSTDPGTNPGGSNPGGSLVGTWIVHVDNIVYDDGDIAGVAGNGRRLMLLADGSWTFESRSGTWTAEGITDADWARWNVASDGSTRKLVLNVTGGDLRDGPVDDTSASPTRLRIIFRVSSPSPGTETIEFSRRNARR